MVVSTTNKNFTLNDHERATIDQIQGPATTRNYWTKLMRASSPELDITPVTAPEEKARLPKRRGQDSRSAISTSTARSRKQRCRITARFWDSWPLPWVVQTNDPAYLALVSDMRAVPHLTGTALLTLMTLVLRR